MKDVPQAKLMVFHRFILTSFLFDVIIFGNRDSFIIYIQLIEINSNTVNSTTATATANENSVK
jgi:hypothetical protein